MVAMARQCLLMLLGFLVMAGCGPSGRSAAPERTAPQAGAGEMLQVRNFQYTIRSENGQELVQGALMLPWPIAEGQTVRGMWESRYVGPRTATQPAGDPNQIGPQVGQGTLVAEREGDEVRISLNPQMSDNNVTLHGTIEGDALRGRWDYSTFIGTTAAGEFEARQQR